MTQSLTNNPLITFENLSKRFGGVAALSDISFDLAEGEIHALVGENGAGKSTLMKCLVGVHAPDSGLMLMRGNPITPTNPSAARKLGIDVVFQEIELAPNLTVAESIFLAREPTRAGVIDRRAMARDAQALLDRIEIPISVHATIETLRTAEKQGVQIARALAFNTRFLIMDEPTSSLSDHEIKKLLGLLENLRTEGTTILYVSHKLEEVLRLSDTVTVLRDGRHVATRPRAGLDKDTLISLMVGQEIADAKRSQSETPAPRQESAVVLECRGLSRGRAFQNVTFQINRGQVMGLFGIVGAGRTELARAIFGLDHSESGAILLEGKPVRFSSATKAVAAGLAFVPEDRKLQGVLLDESIRRNVALTTMSRIAPRGWVRRRAEYAQARDAVSRFAIATRRGVDQEVKALSGGNQQKVVLAKWLATQPKVLILDEPTKGIDIAAKQEVHALIRHFASEGLAVLLISSELDEALALSDQIMVMRGGRIMATLESVSATREAVLALAVSN